MVNTKVIILGQEPKENKQLKPIEFLRYLSADSCFKEIGSAPHDWFNIELISRDYTYDGHDLMFAYDSDRSLGALYLGYFNDGVVL